MLISKGFSQDFFDKRRDFYTINSGILKEYYIVETDCYQLHFKERKVLPSLMNLYYYSLTARS